MRSTHLASEIVHWIAPTCVFSCLVNENDTLSHDRTKKPNSMNKREARRDLTPVDRGERERERYENKTSAGEIQVLLLDYY